ncbi:endolytic transglycosylase MltG [Metabacillus sp. KIGAM252]|uniref:Endolytic murein transglycosylase n=1 Tax=Metabacillus flavus TaxID=2823519 RepID=A0ABS5LGD0_9BACI|nr:endolytic transglycosylase MltG [Metabacillus flavus]MBS2969795.1 endolytic transglycosylase MltG [Metabacillus flavus]
MKQKQNKPSIHNTLLEKQEEAKSIRKIVWRIVLVVGIAFAAIAIAGIIYIQNALSPVDPSDESQVKVSIPLGSSVSGIAAELREEGIIKDARVFKYYVKFKNETNFQAGDYLMSKSMTMDDMIQLLKTGKMSENIAIQFTIPEGHQMTQIAAIIENNSEFSKEDVLKKIQDPAFIAAMKKKYPNTLTNEIDKKTAKYKLEGYLYPATYPFSDPKTSLDTILEKMISETDERIKPYLPQMKEKKWSVHYFLTMSSIIEEEATGKVDRKKIASVFFNRLKSGMPLQTDPTVLYALGEHKDRVTYKDLKVSSPYNTYKNKGLPPGPISNSGNMSMEAALKPDNTDYLYFLAAPDGTVYYSRTLKEHNQLKEKHITGPRKGS